MTISNTIVGNVLKFHSCIFQSSLLFENDSLINVEQLSFNNCRIDYELEFLNINTNNTDNHSRVRQGILITNSSSICSLNITNSILTKSIIIADSKINDFKILSLNNSQGIQIKNSTINTYFLIERCTQLNELNISCSSSIKTEVEIKSSNLEHLIIANSTFEKEVLIKDIDTNEIRIKNSTFYKDVSISIKKLSEILLLYQTEFTKSFMVDYSSAHKNYGKITEQFLLSNITVKDDFNIFGDSTTLNILRINANNRLSGVFNIIGFKETICTLKGSNLNANIYLTDFEFSTLHFKQFFNTSSVSVNNAKGIFDKSKLIIDNSNLSNCNFSNVDFESFTKVEIENSALTNANFINTAWFKHAQLNNHLTKETGYYAKTREVYRQLKFALEKQGDRIQSLEFKRLEMQVFKEDQFSKYKWYERIFNQDRFILWVGQTNNFGQSWLKPVGIFTLFLFPLYFLIMVGLSEKLHYSFYFNDSSVQTTLSEFGKYFYAIPDLINPVHSLKKLFPSHEIPALTYWIDFTLKLISSFFIFQTIAAFRKYMK